MYNKNYDIHYVVREQWSIARKGQHYQLKRYYLTFKVKGNKRRNDESHQTDKSLVFG